ncbi:MAG: PAS domain S-box protein, partial [Nitrospirae bacterium]|nr:PAS domain S-box protein [Nitrospirota bacterium]
DICRIICDDADYQMAWVGYATNDGAAAVRPVAWAGVENGYLAEVKITYDDSEKGRGPTGTAIRSGNSAVIQDFSTDPHAAPWRESALRRGYRSSIAMPLKDEGANAFGALTIYSRDPNAFTPDELQLLEELAGDLAFGITVLRIRNERDMAEGSLKLFRKLIDYSNDAIFVIDPETSGFLDVNYKACSDLGYDREQLIKMRTLDITTVVPDNLSWKAHVDKVRSEGHIVLEDIHKRRDGTLFPVEVNVTFITMDKGNYMLAVARDLTERKKLEAQLLQSQKLEAVGQLAGGIAHDFNNMLTAIIGYASLLRTKIDRDSPLKLFADQILSSAEKSANLTRQLLAFSRKQIIAPRETDLNELIKSMEKLLMRVIGEDIEFKTQLADKPLAAMIDPGQIEQVLMNLSTNARDAMPEGGLLSICTGIVELDTQYVRGHDMKKPGKYILLSVTDTGRGMDEKTQQKIFEPF